MKLPTAIALLVAVLGALSAAKSMKNVRRRRRILTTPTTPIANAPGGALVEVKGRIVPSEQGLLRSPFSNRDAVWFRVTVEELRRRRRTAAWHTLVSEIDTRVFEIDDGSGQRARVEPARAEVLLHAQSVATSGTFKDAPPELERFLATRGLASTSWLGFNKTMRFQEEVLAPGDSLYALGPARRDPGPPTPAGAYRSGASSQLVLYDMGAGDLELILSNKSEQELARRLVVPFVVSVSVTMIALCAALAAALVRP